MWIVQLALRRPYTFVVLAMLIVLMGTMAILRTPTDIYPEIDIPAVAAFTDADVARLLADAGIVRNRAKINAAIGNARAALELKEGLSDLVWSYADAGPRPAPRTLVDIPPQTPASKQLAKELRARGFVFTGPVTVYAAMQACGLVNDHLAECFARGVAIDSNQ